MKNKILNIILVLGLLLFLTSCLELKEDNNYKSESIYETKLIETTNELEKSTVSILHKGKTVASAVIVDKSNEIAGTLYTAITAAEPLLNYAEGMIINLSVATNNTLSISPINKYALNENYDIGVIQFYSKTKLTPVTYKFEDKAFDYEVGQSIITIGTSNEMSQFNNSKTGIISNDKLPYKDIIMGYAFMHDAVTNPGNKGSGVFDLDGNLVGINIHLKSELKIDEIDINEHVLRFTLAAPVKHFINVLDNKDSFIDTLVIPDELFDLDNSKVVKYDSKFDYEKNNININTSLNDKTITAKLGEDIASGLVFKKDVRKNTYWVLTKEFENYNNLEIFSHNFEKLDVIKSINLTGFYLSMHKVFSKNELSVYNSVAIDESKGTNLIEGQQLLTIGSPIDLKYANTLNKSTVSKAKDSNDEIFMHEGNLNHGQQGAPLFNLNGELVGFNLNKINEIVISMDPITQSVETIMTEGLSYAININYLSDAINHALRFNIDLPKSYNKVEIENLSEYQPKLDDEKRIIEVVKDVRNKTVTVKNSNSHGSGVIYNKEKLKDNEYRYSVLTNHHVIEDVADELLISFNDGSKDIYARDYTYSPNYDLGIVRFISEKDYGTVNIQSINNNIHINPLKGQKVIAVGTPGDMSRTGYVTTGNITTKPISYKAKLNSPSISKLAIVHDTAINPGNSGGPLFDSSGNLIGLNVSKRTYFETYEDGVSKNIAAEGVGTSLNLNVLSLEIKSFRSRDFVELKPKLGIVVANLEDYIGLPNLLPVVEYGVLIVDIDEYRDSLGKIFEYDVITAINGNKIKSVDEIANQLKGKGYLDEITIEGYRLTKDGKTVEFKEKVQLK